MRSPPLPAAAPAREARRIKGRRRAAVIPAVVVLALLGGGCSELSADTESTSNSTGQGLDERDGHKHTSERERAADLRRRAERESRRAQEQAERSAGSAASLAAGLTVRGRAPMTGYDRDRFGQAWLGADRNGCDTRNEILGRDLATQQLRPGQDCVVERGDLEDPFTRSRIVFARGVSYSVDIDHVVALGNAWVSRAWKWDIHQRAAVANDPLNLLAVDAGANRQKSDGDAATWLPYNTGYRCAYVARQVTVKSKYGLSVTPAERDAVRRVLATCPGQPATPDPAHAPTRVDQSIVDPGAGSGSGGSSTAPGRGEVYFENCDAARAAGAAPVYAGGRGYGPHLDRDGDGIACE